MIGKPKAPDDVRPIVPQSLIIRMGGKLLISSGGKDIKRVVDPWQAAVGVAAGCETMSSIFRQAMYRSRDSVGFVTDKKNGYGETKRDELLAVVLQRVPFFARFMLMVYADHLILFFVGATRPRSRCGTARCKATCWPPSGSQGSGARPRGRPWRRCRRR